MPLSRSILDDNVCNRGDSSFGIELGIESTELECCTRDSSVIGL